MMMKIMGGRGSGGGAGVINYLLGKDRNRDRARVLRGDPERTRLLIDSLNFSQRYVSGVLSFEEEDIDENLKHELIEDFQKTLIPDMDGRVNWLWVEHRDKSQTEDKEKKRLELNFVIPTVDLETGKRIQPYYHKADLTRMKAWKALQNDLHLFADPDDPSREQAITIKTNESQENKDLKKQITAYLSEQIAAGAVSGRDDFGSALQKFGFTVSRKTKTSMTFTHAESGNKYRLKGSIYSEDFGNIEQFREQKRERIAAFERDRGARIERNRATLNDSMEIKRRDIERRYRRDDSRANEADQTATQRSNERVKQSWSDIRESIQNTVLVEPSGTANGGVSDWGVGLHDQGDRLPSAGSGNGGVTAIQALEDRRLLVQRNPDMRDGDVLQQGARASEQRRNNGGLEVIDNDRDRAIIARFNEENERAISASVKDSGRRIREQSVRCINKIEHFRTIFRERFEKFTSSYRAAARNAENARRVRERLNVIGSTIDGIERDADQIATTARIHNRYPRDTQRRVKRRLDEIRERNNRKQQQRTQQPTRPFIRR